MHYAYGEYLVMQNMHTLSYYTPYSVIGIQHESYPKGTDHPGTGGVDTRGVHDGGGFQGGGGDFWGGGGVLGGWVLWGEEPVHSSK